MPSRVLNLFLALVLLWSGFGSFERPDTDQSADERWGFVFVQPLDAGDGWAGSVEDHHLDDQPSQSHAETASELPALLLATVWLEPVAAREAMPPAPAATALPEPYAEGPRRPPRG